MAAYSNLASWFDTNPGGSIANLTPLATGLGDLAIVFVGTTGNATPAAVADDNAGGSAYSLVNSALRNTSADVFACYVRNAPLTAAASTFTATLGANTGGFIVIVLVSGISRYGAAAVRRSAREENQTVGNAAPSYSGGAAFAANMQLTCINNELNPPTATAPAGFVSRIADGYITPTTGFRLYTIDNGNTSTTLTWGGSSGNLYSDMAVELDASPDPVAGLATTPFPPLGRGATW